MPLRHEILRFGEPTIDGRFIEQVDLDGESLVPLMELGDDGRYAVVGSLSNFTIEGNRVYCESNVDVPLVTVSVTGATTAETGLPLTIYKVARITGGYVTDNPDDYPWKD